MIVSEKRGLRRGREPGGRRRKKGRARGPALSSDPTFYGDRRGFGPDSDKVGGCGVSRC